MTDIETFALERNQTLYENEVEINLTESGVEPLTIETLLAADEIATLHRLRLGYNYTEGTPALRAAIASWYPGAAPENVLATTGASEANFIASWSLLSRGDRLAFMVPNFMQLPGIAHSLGAEVATFPLDPTNAWRLDRKVFAAAAAGAKLIALCHPNNPSGAVMNEEERAFVVEIAKKNDSWLLCDEIYRGLELDDRPETPTFWGRYPKTIITASTSKSLAHAGLRIGWVVAPPDFVYECMRRQDYTTIGTGPINQYLATIILTPHRRAAILARSRSILGRNLKIIDDWIARWNGQLAYDRPAAGGMVFVRYSFAIGSVELATRIRQEKSTLVVAGDWFGMDGHIRIGTGGHEHELAEGLLRIDEVLAAIP